MKRGRWVKLFEAAALVFGYFWYKASIPAVMARMLF